MFLVALIVLIAAPVTLVERLECDDSLAATFRQQLVDEVLRCFSHLACVSWVHIHLDRHGSIARVPPEAQELDLTFVIIVALFW